MIVLLLLPLLACASSLDEALVSATARAERAMGLKALCNVAPEGEEEYLCRMAANEFRYAADKTEFAVRIWLRWHLCNLAKMHPAAVEAPECGSG